MKKILIILVIALVALLTWRLIVRHNDEVAGWQFIRRVTGFEFPDGTKYLAQFDDAEMRIIGAAKLPREAALDFARKYAFGKEAQCIECKFYIQALPKQYQKISSADTLSAVGQTKFQSWEAILDSETGLLWIYIQYPDWSGDHSGWGPQPHRAQSSGQP